MYLMLLNVCTAPQITPRHCLLTNKVQNISSPIHVVYLSTETAQFSCTYFSIRLSFKIVKCETILVKANGEKFFY